MIYGEIADRIREQIERQLDMHKRGNDVGSPGAFLTADDWKAVLWALEGYDIIYGSLERVAEAKRERGEKR